MLYGLTPLLSPKIVLEFEKIVQHAVQNHNAPAVKMHTLNRFAFYEQANTCYSIIQTGETRLYGNVLLKKGVIGT